MVTTPESVLIQTRLLASVLPTRVVVAVEAHFPLSLLRHPTYLIPLFYYSSQCGVLWPRVFGVVSAFLVSSTYRCFSGLRMRPRFHNTWAGLPSTLLGIKNGFTF